MTCNKYIDKINNNSDAFVVFYMSTKYCSFSRKAFELLRKYKQSYKGYKMKDPLINLNKKKELIKCLKLKGKHETFPIIFHKGKFIGGYTELKMYIHFLQPYK